MHAQLHNIAMITKHPSVLESLKHLRSQLWAGAAMSQSVHDSAWLKRGMLVTADCIHQVTMIVYTQADLSSRLRLSTFSSSLATCMTPSWRQKKKVPSSLASLLNLSNSVPKASSGTCRALLQS